MDYFGCNTDENKIHFLKVLLIYEKLEDILKESSLEQVKIINKRIFVHFINFYLFLK